MDSFEAHSEWMRHAVLPPDLQQLDQCQPPSLTMSEPFAHQPIPLFDLPASPTAPDVHTASCSGATHLELAESVAERTDDHSASLLMPVADCDADAYTNTSPALTLFHLPEQAVFAQQQHAFSKLHHSYFATNKERIKHELEMALQKPAQTTPSRTNSERSFVSTQANSSRSVHSPIANKRVSKTKRSKTNKSKRTRAPARPWTEEEHQRFKESLELYGRNWEQCAKYIGTRRAQLVRSHAQKYLIKLWKLGLPLPNKVAESGRGYTLSGKPLLADSASAKSYLTRISGPTMPLNQNN